MAKDISYEIEEVICSLNENNGWSKSVAKISWNNNPYTIDIRNMNLDMNIIGKGISLKDEEVDTLVEVLVERGYGNLDELIESINKRKRIYSYDDGETIQNNKLVIRIEE